MKKTLLFIFFGLALISGCETSTVGSPDASPDPEMALRVAIYVGPGACGFGTLRHVQIGAFARGVEEVLVDDALIRQGVLGTVDVLVVPGGSSPTMVEALGKDGVGRIRDFVAAGGGYIGTCAGAIVGSVSVPGYRDGMAGLAPYATGSTVARPSAEVFVRWTPAAAEVLGGDFTGRQRVSYSWGPVFTPTEDIEGASFRTLATYDSEYLDTERPAMFGKVAIVAGTYKKGRVFLSAVHPEVDLDDHNLLRAALRFVSGLDTTWDIPQRARRGQLAVAVGADESLGVDSMKTLHGLMRDETFDVSFVGIPSLASGDYDWTDVLLVPASRNSPETPSVGLGKNTARTKAFLARGGRIVVWGPFAADYAKLGMGVTVVSNGTEAIDALYRIDRETKPVEVAYYTDSHGACEELVGVLARTPSFRVRFVTRADILAGGLKGTDLLVMPGGDPNGQCRSLGRDGAEEVVRFVREGGMYYGVGAGAFLASRTVDASQPRLDLVPWKDPAMVCPGCGDVKIKLTDAGSRVLGGESSRMVFYRGGPVFEPAESVDDAEIEVLATYDWHVIGTAVTGPFRPMDGRAAILAGRVGKGKVYLQSPHSEMREETFDLVRSALKYLTGREVTGTLPVYSRGQLVVGCEAPRDAAFANFYLKLIGCHNVFYRNIRYGHPANDMKRLDVLIIAKPQARIFARESIRAFIESGRPVYVVAETDAEREACEDVSGIEVVDSYDAILSRLGCCSTR